MTISRALALLATLGVAGSASWIGRRAWQMYRHHFSIEGPVWMIKRERGAR